MINNTESISVIINDQEVVFRDLGSNSPYFCGSFENQTLYYEKRNKNKLKSDFESISIHSLLKFAKGYFFSLSKAFLFIQINHKFGLDNISFNENQTKIPKSVSVEEGPDINIEFSVVEQEEQRIFGINKKARKLIFESIEGLDEKYLESLFLRLQIIFATTTDFIIFSDTARQIEKSMIIFPQFNVIDKPITKHNIPYRCMLIQNYFQYPKWLSNVLERFLAAYRVIEAHYTILWKYYLDCIDGNEKGLSNKLYSHATELEKLELVFYSTPGIGEEIMEKIREEQFHNHFLFHKFSNGLRIGEIKLDSIQDFIKTMSLRIYFLRCAIVHSDPKFSQRQGDFYHVPLSILSIDDIFEIDNEIALLEAILLRLNICCGEELKQRIEQIFIRGIRIPLHKS